MTRRDYRCAFSGVSLLDAEVAVVLIQRTDAGWRPVSLPLFGIYEGLGTVAEINDGPNADLVLSSFQRGIQHGTTIVDFAAMGIEEQQPDHIETLLSLVAVSQLGGEGALRAAEGPFGFTLLSAHVAAALMAAEPTLPLELTVDDLANAVFEAEFGREMYAPLREESHRMRCKFGLSMIGLAALCERMKAAEKDWQPPGEGLTIVESNRALWLGQAIVQWSEDELLSEALDEYGGQWEEEGSAI